jgi:integrase
MLGDLFESGYFDLKALAAYSSCSVRWLRDRLVDRLHPLPHHRIEGKILVKREEFDRWLSSSHAHTKTAAPTLYPALLCAACTGLRQGELLALQWEDGNFAWRFVEIRRNFTHGKMTTPKSGESRRVDLSRELTATLETLQLNRQFEAATHGWKEVPSMGLL